MMIRLLPLASNIFSLNLFVVVQQLYYGCPYMHALFQMQTIYLDQSIHIHILASRQTNNFMQDKENVILVAKGCSLTNIIVFGS